MQSEYIRASIAWTAAEDARQHLVHAALRVVAVPAAPACAANTSGCEGPGLEHNTRTPAATLAAHILTGGLAEDVAERT
jgi:hypothetical protein